MEQDELARIKVWIKCTFPHLTLFRIEIGDIEGLFKWKRKQDYFEWLDALEADESPHKVLAKE